MNEVTNHELAVVAIAAARRNAAREEYRDAILAARRAGHSLRTIANAAGISKQACGRLITRNEG